jgi:hypothetical protein
MCTLAGRHANEFSSKLHHVAGARSGEGLRRQPEAERARERWTVRLLLKKLDLLRDELDHLLELLELCRHELEKRLNLCQLLLLQPLELLQLLWNDLQELLNLLERLCPADSISRLIRERLTILLRKRLDAERLARIWTESP